MSISPNETIDAQRTRLHTFFKEKFGKAPTVTTVAPGRVNLIGEHTDYNDGFVLPMAIERQTMIAAAPSGSSRCTLSSTGMPDTAEWDVTDHLVPGKPTWANYVKGVFAGWKNRDGVLPGTLPGLDEGVDMVIDSTVPLGGGLSSSAALECATATLLEALTDHAIDPTDKALLAQQAEHRFAGVPCGIMDQFISSLGRVGCALLIDCRSREPRAVRMADPSVCVLIANTNVKHELTGGEYAQRRAQCEEAAGVIGVPALRDATVERLESAAVASKLSTLAKRRARHVVTENRRTLEAVGAIEKRDWFTMGQLMVASHVSLRDDFEVSCDELDIMVELALGIGQGGGVYGSRMTGGGFGGCTVSIVQSDRAEKIASILETQYRQKTGISPTIFVSQPAAGARILHK
ncbi:MAG: galactokinase [Phycisphaera sp.]|nr:galactokinase [Phycisphaera sp.]